MIETVFTERKEEVVQHNIDVLKKAASQIHPQDIVMPYPYVYHFAIDQLLWTDKNISFPNYELQVKFFDFSSEGVLQFTIDLVGIVDPKQHPVHIGSRKTIFILKPESSHLSPSMKTLAEKNQLLLITPSLKIQEPRFEGNGIGQALAQLSNKSTEVLKSKVDVQTYRFILSYVIDAAKPVDPKNPESHARDRWTTNLVEKSGYQKDVGDEYFSWEFIRNQRSTWDRLLVKVLQNLDQDPPVLF